MKTHKLILITIVLFAANLCPIHSFAQNKTTPPHKIYKNEIYNISYPESWRVDDSKSNGVDLFLFSPLTDGDNFTENVNVLIQDLKGMEMDLEKYKKISENQFAGVLPNSEILESVIIGTMENKYLKLSFKYRQSQFDIKGTSICYILNEKAYMITFTALDTTYDLYKSVGEKIQMSFAFNK
jgi:hypothetical protein